MPARSVLDELHRRRQQGIQRAVGAGLGVLLRAMPSLDEESLAFYVDGAYPIVAGGQTTAGETAAGYIGVIAAARARAREQRHRLRRPPDVLAALTRSGVLVQPDSRSLVAPVLRARALEADGMAAPAALEAASSYADALASNAMQAAQRVGLGEGAAANGLEVDGWRKQLGPGACSWCNAIANGVYADPDAVPYHDNERCGVEPELDDADTNYVYDDSDIPF